MSPFISQECGYKLLCMLKRKSKNKINSQSANHSRSTPQNCSLCQNHKQVDTPSIDTIISHSLTHKYTQAEINACQISNIQTFLSGASRIYPGGYPEFEKVYFVQGANHLFKKFYSISQTKQRVTKLIKAHINSDKRYLMHFQSPYWFYLLRHQTSQQLCKNLALKKHGIHDDLKSTGTGEAKKAKAENKELYNLILEQSSTKNQSSLEQLRNLTKNIGKMCLKFKNKAPLILNNPKKKKNQTEKEEYQFKYYLEKKISFIQPISTESKDNSKKNKKSFQRVEKNRPKKAVSKDSKEIYGLDQNYVLKKSSTQKVSIFTTTGLPVRANEKAGRTILDSPASQAYYLKDIVQTQKVELVSVKDKRKKGFKNQRSLNSLSKSRGDANSGSSSKRHMASLSKGKKVKILWSNFFE